MDCIFCKIIKGEIPSNKLYEDDKIIAFHDINPEAKVHFLIVPKEHICCADKIDRSNSAIIAYIFEKIPELARKANLTNGYRIINNCGEDACQSVKHIHFHIIGGEKLPEHIK